MLVSTLKRYVEAMGGKLAITHSQSGPDTSRVGDHY
jgi:hypothetical protein